MAIRRSTITAGLTVLTALVTVSLAHLTPAALPGVTYAASDCTHVPSTGARTDNATQLTGGMRIEPAREPGSRCKSKQGN